MFCSYTRSSTECKTLSMSRMHAQIRPHICSAAPIRTVGVSIESLELATSVCELAYTLCEALCTL